MPAARLISQLRCTGLVMGLDQQLRSWVTSAHGDAMLAAVYVATQALRAVTPALLLRWAVLTVQLLRCLQEVQLY